MPSRDNVSVAVHTERSPGTFKDDATINHALTDHRHDQTTPATYDARALACLTRRHKNGQRTYKSVIQADTLHILSEPNVCIQKAPFS